MGSITPKSDLPLPVKTHEVHNHHQDSTVWNDFPFRHDDIVVATYAKSGTTWTQQIVSQLLHKGDPTVSPGLLSPWVDIRVLPREVILGELEKQTSRRYMKTHLPADALVMSPKAKYIYVGRDGRDMIWSIWHHFHVATPEFFSMINDTPGRVGPECIPSPEDPRDLFLDFIEDDTRQTIGWPYWSHNRSWWAVRNQPNVLFVHFADLKKDLAGEMRRIAKFLDIEDLSDKEFNAALEHSTFDWMKENAHLMAPPQAEIAFQGGAKSFINKGTNGRWRDRLSEEDSKRFDQKAREELGEECAAWFEHGGHAY